MRYKKNNRGSYILTDKNGNDFTVTKKEYEEISKLTKRANQRRVDVAHRYFDSMVDSNVMVGVDYEAYMTLLQRRGFITEKYTSSLQQFNSKADVKEHLKELRAVTKRGYGKDRLDNVRYKLIEQIDEQFGESGIELKGRFMNMSNAELLSVYLMADKDIIAELFYLSETTDIDDFIESTNTYLDRLIHGSKSPLYSQKEYKKGFKNYKQRQKYKKEKRSKKGRR